MSGICWQQCGHGFEATIDGFVRPAAAHRIPRRITMMGTANKPNTRKITIISGKPSPPNAPKANAG
jgi:hypothetical protein